MTFRSTCAVGSALALALAVVIVMVMALGAAARKGEEPRAAAKVLRSVAQQRYALSWEQRALVSELRLENYRPDPVVLERHEALSGELLAEKDPKQARALLVKFERASSDVLRFDETLVVELSGDRTWKVVRQPAAWPMLEGGRRKFPVLVANRSGAAMPMKIRTEASGPAVLERRIGSGSDWRALVPIHATADREEATLRLSAGEHELDVKVVLQLAESGLVKVRVLDEVERPAPVRLYVRAGDGRFYAPQGLRKRLTSKDEPFVHAPASFQIRLPLGRSTLELVRGFEYRVAEVDVDVEPGGGSAEVRLERWVDMPGLGWFSGDGHVHMNYQGGVDIDPTEAFLSQQAEDVHVANTLVANIVGDDVQDERFFEGRPHRLSTDRHQMRWNEEYRSSLLGHLILYGLDSLTNPIYSGFGNSPLPHHFPLNADIAAQALTAGGTVTGAHPSWTLNEHPIDVALGQMHGLEIVGYGANYGASVGLIHALWSTGFRTVATAGTDAMLDHVRSDPLGGARTYVRVGEGFDEAGWVAGLRAGRSFVSTAPVLFLTVGESEPGDSVRLAAPAKVRVRVSARSQWPLTDVTLFYNGQVVARRVASQGETDLLIEQDLVLSESGWIAAQCFGPHNRHVFGGGLNLEHPQVAHTSPVWVEIEGRPAPPSKSLSRLIKSVASFQMRVEKKGSFANPAQRAHMRSTYEKARGVFEAKLEAGAKGS